MIGLGVKGESRIIRHFVDDEDGHILMFWVRCLRCCLRGRAIDSGIHIIYKSVLFSHGTSFVRSSLSVIQEQKTPSYIKPLVCLSREGGLSVAFIY